MKLIPRCIWGRGLKSKEDQQDPENERARCWQGLLVTGSSGDAGMERGRGDTEN